MVCKWHHPNGRKQRGTKEPLDESGRREWKKLVYSLTFRKQIMASSPIISWQIDEETVTDFIFLGSKISADGDWSHEINRHLFLERKAMTNLDSILKSRDITLPTKVHLVKAVVFPRVMYGCESWTIKKAECWRIDASELWYWRRFLRVPWTTRRSNRNHPCIFSGRTDTELKPQYFGHLIWRANSWKRPWCWAGREGATEDEMVRWHHQLNGHEF